MLKLGNISDSRTMVYRNEDEGEIYPLKEGEHFPLYAANIESLEVTELSQPTICLIIACSTYGYCLAFFNNHRHFQDILSHFYFAV